METDQEILQTARRFAIWRYKYGEPDQTNILAGRHDDISPIVMFVSAVKFCREHNISLENNSHKFGEKSLT